MFFRKYLILFFIFAAGFSVTAQMDTLVYHDASSNESSPIAASAEDSVISLPEGFSQSLEELANDWLSTRFQIYDCDSLDFPVNVSDSIVKLRLSKLPNVMEMPFNPYIRAFIDMYTIKKRKMMSYMLGMSDYYFKIFEQSLSQANLPLELKYLPIIESALRPSAKSRVGAAGLWQFMISTGRMYGLEINSLVDERLDPIKATHSATRFLKDLYDIYGDWNMVIAAYNCGPGNVNKAIRRSGGKRDYWTIYPYLPRETRGYVPIFIAANYAMNFAPEHKICKAEITIPVVVDTVVVHERLHLEQIAHTLDIPIEEIQLLNPQYKMKIVPGDIKPYSVVIPMDLSGDFIDKFDEIRSYKSDSLLLSRRMEINLASTSTSSSDGNGRLIYHKVRSGQNLGTIAKRYGVTVANLKKWNRLKSSMIKVGQRIKVYN